MEKPFNERLRSFVDYLINNHKVYNDADFCRKINKNTSQVSEYLTGKRRITEGFVRHLVSFYPILNGDYLLDESETEMLNLNHGNVKGNNNMVNNGHDQHVAIENGLKQADKIINTLQAQIERQQAQIDKLLSIIEKMQS